MPALTEIVVALGAGRDLVGIGRFDPEVPGREGLPRLGDALSVSLESVAALHADHVLVNGAGLAQRLRPLGGSARVELLATDRLSDVFDAVRRLGEITGRPLSAHALSDRLHAALTAARERAAARGGPGPRTLVIVQRRPLYVAGGGSYLHELLLAVGARNAVGDIDDAWPVLSEESVAARSPDVVLDASVGAAAEDVRPAPLAGVPADRVRRLGPEAEPLFRAGPRLPEALALLEQLLYDDEGTR